ncbi:MAG: A/G-specific adenine glycosylase [candidate division KSB1 bacterium]|nr:A/G-specific adenine glycosylase [candidate division KSB1 bacterium]MDZ7288143.1 A/G-specific adenine glycosylase [candidate division KSB1 bacterium]MDZ7300344.1 A/G-specific adenine glycosylase [candidate division KSB1 bacterium]MDZ7306157.1 A/G-specific adenine glycosylase [candidate division KSB1 bacterium]MDZ7351344.1 A/G-specific adenine glycosylase [candidate division KSB1 bacterium]
MPRTIPDLHVHLDRIPPARRRALQHKLLHWYAAAQRDLPWRRQRDPYAIWVAEVMLQQTQTAKVVAYYDPFLQRFPTLTALARAPLDDVLKAWEGMGYYARARHLHRAAQYVHEAWQGELPRDYDGLLQIPGIGPYTAAAIASIAFNRDQAVVDGNVERVLSRLFQVTLPPREPPGKKLFRALAQALLKAGRARDWNQAMMELGALVCTPRRPACGQCPAKNYCCAYNHLHDPAQLPARRRKPPLPHHHLAVALVWKRGRVLINQRPARGLLGGLWEFPNTALQQGERHATALRRALRRQLVIEVKVGKSLMTIEHGYTHFRATLHVYHCAYLRGQPQALACQRWKWVAPGDLHQYAFSTANRRIIAALANENGVV